MIFQSGGVPAARIIVTLPGARGDEKDGNEKTDEKTPGGAGRPPDNTRITNSRSGLGADEHPVDCGDSFAFGLDDERIDLRFLNDGALETCEL